MFEEFKKHLETKEVMSGVVKLVSPSEGLLLDYGTLKVVIPNEEIEAYQKVEAFPFLAGKTIDFVITCVDEENNIVTASRKQAQERNFEEVVQRLTDGEVMTATITNILDFGCYVEIMGVPGLLKNYNFASDTTLIREVKAVGDTVDVLLDKQAETGKLLLKAAEKYCSPTSLNFDNFEKGMSILGTVVSIKPFGIFVRIANETDALCPFPEFEHEITENMKVSMVITRIREEEKRIAGKIKKIIPVA